MKVRVQTGNILTSAPVTLQNAGSVVVYDDYDQPILVVQKQEDGQLLMSRAGDPKFYELLQILGIGLNATVTVGSLPGGRTS